MTSKIITAKVFIQAAGTSTFARRFLGDPGPSRAYRIESFDVTLFDNGAGLNDGVIVGLQDGEIEPGLLAVTEAGNFAEFVNTDAILLTELQVYYTAGLPAFGTGRTGFSTVNKTWADFVTANEQHLLIKVQDSGTKKLYVHLEYTEIRVPQREYLALKHRSPVVDTVLSAVT